jgi:hypothetical protein
MNTIKRVKILITLGILANTLCITPILAQPSNPDPTTAAANVPDVALEYADRARFLLAMNQAFEPGEEVGIRVTDEARQYADLEVEGDVALFTFNEKGMDHLIALGDEQGADLIKGLAQSYGSTANSIPPVFFLTNDAGGRALATAVISEGKVESMAWANNRGSKARDFKITKDRTTGNLTEPESQSAVIPAQKQGGGSPADALPK